MAEKNFVQVGYMKNGEYVPGKQRAKDIEASDGTSAEAHITDAAKHLTADQAQKIAGAVQSSEKGAQNGIATLGADGKIPANQLDLAKYATSANVDDYDAMLALSVEEAPVNSFVFVKDASKDATVESGWASYKRVAAEGNKASDWCKVAEGESLDVVFPDYTNSIKDAKDAAEKLDFAYCTDEADMQSKNLREGAMVLMAVENSAD